MLGLRIGNHIFAQNGLVDCAGYFGKENGIAGIVYTLCSIRVDTVFRQTMFASFEEQIHSRVENGQDLSAKIVNDIYFDLVSKYFGNGVKLFKEVQYEWSRIPHFYTPFYVYKYATGIISAINIVENLSTGKITVDDYKKFLSSGCTDTPTELLKIVKVDFDTEEPFAVAFDYIKTMLKDLKSLLTNPKK